MSFVFYDTETTGIRTAFDQILQFAAIRTDYDLNELERFEIRCRLLPYIVPSPGAVRITGTTVEELLDPSLPSHYEMIRSIRAKLSAWSPAIFIGHNSLRFDEHLFRQALYKTLHNPYLTNLGGNCRADSLRMIRAIAQFAPGALSIPVDESGRQVFNLGSLAQANGLDHQGAHDAMADVEATIHMCRLIAERCPDHWSNFLRFAQKAAVSDFCQEEELFVLADYYSGTAHCWIVTRIGQNPENGAEAFVFDLSVDPDELSGLDEAELLVRLSTFPAPVRGLRMNACPILLTPEDMPEHLRLGGPESNELRRRAARIRSDSVLMERLVTALLVVRGERPASVHVEQQIYDSFIANEDQAAMDRFHDAEWCQRAPIIAQLSDTRLRSLGNRLIYVEAPHTMPEPMLNDYEAAIARRLMSDDDVPWLTLPKALQEADDLIGNSPAANAANLVELRAFLSRRIEQAAPFLS